MGSFTSSHTYDNGDHEDKDIALPESINCEELLASFEKEAVADIRLRRVFTRFNSQNSTSEYWLVFL